MTPMDKGSHRIDRRRLEDAMERAGYKTKSGLAEAVGVWPSQINNWLIGKTTPSGENLDRLCEVLHATSAYLFGKAEHRNQRDSLRAAVLDQVRAAFGRAEAEVLENMSRLTPHHQAILSGRIVGWVEALEAMERDGLPVTPFDLDRVRLAPPVSEPIETAPPDEDEEPLGPQR